MSFSLARKRKEVEKKEQLEGSTGGSSSPGLVRLKKDVNELYLPSTMKVRFDPDDISKFSVEFTPNEGYWKGGLFQFRFDVPLKDYPHKPPSVLCLTQVYHPNINREGKICLNILREDWRPFYTITSVLQSLQLLFNDLVNPDDPLNKEAATLMKTNLNVFKNTVSASVRGGVSIDGAYYSGNRA
eukprot:Plantae.Rhodophyta-Purpureofilum_apyrenoidigerum.ctg24001.p1 GENE.Plantae.Rhodophyta-Purpureofilum_apyrenoidigerum.ctg24001~~Plantae.Rhodophyta-Purpureofilum_apyrenoidigerum.ctg24001.p1  ORF type:complete len:185 (-),score=26.87 Plantae.Rhodophyta-Purpureofilum_apyrenoidigerum.ctg24001:272-826(-)